MKVSVQYAQEHFADILSAAYSGEDVEIAQAGNPPVHVTLVATKSSDTGCAGFDSNAVWLTPERPRSEFLGSLEGKLELSEDWDSPETNEEVEHIFERSEVFPDTLRG